MQRGRIEGQRVRQKVNGGGGEWCRGFENYKGYEGNNTFDKYRRKQENTYLALAAVGVQKTLRIRDTCSLFVQNPIVVICPVMGGKRIGVK
ncbi:hypothetical protein EYF80_032014 [Liparis tanakae]|uniref:Uncharacterized protein n=1 Tax=Liparis tanakae TaxID=230148 RepID=A0A4Z2GW40_9TELE|nr:hypothetical protein EYF80_032014 [Liparis tanakae]